MHNTRKGIKSSHDIQKQDFYIEFFHFASDWGWIKIVHSDLEKLDFKKIISSVTNAGSEGDKEDENQEN